jgi:cystathionine gamma-lyase
MDDLYGGTYRLLTGVLERAQGLAISYVDMTDPGAVANAITERTKLIWVETPTNPQLKLVDLAAVAETARRDGILTVCDNTFATPMLQRPLEQEFDMVLHSATKYLGGHSDVIAGIVVTSRPELAKRLRFLQNSVGAILGPFESYLVLRGVKTLAVRMRQHCESAARIAEWLQGHPKVERVAYPGLSSHPQHDLAQRQMRLECSPSGGGMVTMWLAGGLEESRRFLEAAGVFTLAESLGGVESLIEHPAINSLIRLSVGIEETGDLLADLEQALDAV